MDRTVVSEDGCNVNSLSFDLARQYLKPGRLFKLASYIYAERTELIAQAIHFACTVIVWANFGLIKYRIQKDVLSVETSYYWVKAVVPAVIYGSKHAILLQMALLPLTMARYTIAAVCDSIIGRFLPLKRMIRIHIYLGYILLLLIMFATVGLFTFYGTMCAQGEQEYCGMMRSEIMMTGCAIAIFAAAVGITTFFRDCIPYELFYVMHQLVLLMYGVTIAHTLDNGYRNGNRERSQCFSWVSASLLYYICDRVSCYTNNRYSVDALDASTVKKNMVILKLSRPTLFEFKAGQYVFLRVPEIDSHWHPFSIASGPDDFQLAFYIEVLRGDSWTSRLHHMIVHERLGQTESIEILGPFGTSMFNTKAYSHGLAIGTSTGIVPMFSLLRQHLRQLSRLDPASHFEILDNNQRHAREIEKARLARGDPVAVKVAKLFLSRQSQSSVKSSEKWQRRESTMERLQLSLSSYSTVGENSSGIFSLDELTAEDAGDAIARLDTDLESAAEMTRAARKAFRSIYGLVLLALMPVIGATLTALMISFNAGLADADLADIRSVFLVTFAGVFQLSFAFVSLFIWDGSHLIAIVDAVFTLLAPFTDWYLFHVFKRDGWLHSKDVILFCIFNGYIGFRLWYAAVGQGSCSWNSSERNLALDRIDVVWISRSAALVSQLLPEINQSWEEFTGNWGEDVRRVVRLKIFVTDTDRRSVRELKALARETSLGADAVVFGRPELDKIIEGHTLDMIASRRTSRTVLAFCGSPKLSKQLHQTKISNDILAHIVGQHRHAMDFVSESFGGSKKSKKS